VIGNFHAQFLEGWTAARSSGYSGNFHAKFLEGRAAAQGRLATRYSGFWVGESVAGYGAGDGENWDVGVSDGGSERKIADELFSETSELPFFGNGDTHAVVRRPLLC
jgi:hypothetical protein